MVWISNMGAINKKIMKEIGWKQIKDTFALFKTVCETGKNVIKYHDTLNKLKSLKKDIFNKHWDMHMPITNSDRLTESIFKLILQR